MSDKKTVQYETLDQFLDAELVNQRVRFSKTELLDLFAMEDYQGERVDLLTKHFGKLENLTPNDVMNTLFDIVRQYMLYDSERSFLIKTSTSPSFMGYNSWKEMDIMQHQESEKLKRMIQLIQLLIREDLGFLLKIRFKNRIIKKDDMLEAIIDSDVITEEEKELLMGNIHFIVPDMNKVNVFDPKLLYL